MRVAAQVLLAYVVLLVLSAVWRHVPIDNAVPDVVALFAVYLGLTARTQVAPPTLGAVIIGYLGDLLMGTPRGMLALVAGVLCIVGHLVHRRLLVRGRLLTLAFSFLTGAASSVVMLLMRLYVGVELRGFGAEAWTVLGTAVLTALAGPLVFTLCRRIDGRFARTERERTAAVQGYMS